MGDILISLLYMGALFYFGLGNRVCVCARARSRVCVLGPFFLAVT